LHLLVFERPSVKVTVSLMAMVSVPTVLLVAWQTWWITATDSELWSSGYVFAPIGGPPFGWRQLGWVYWSTVVWVPLAVVVTRGAWLKERLVRLAWCCLVFALAIFLLFRETGARAGHGNLGVPLQVCMVVLILLAMGAVAREAVDAWRRPTGRPRWLLPVGVLLGAFLVGGAISYLDAIGWIHIPIRWGPPY
jgi:hypothetical protein